MRIDKYIDLNYAKQIGLAPDEIQYLYWVKENIPDLERSGFALSIVREQLKELIDEWDLKLETYIENRSTDNFFNNIDRIRLEIIESIKIKSSRLEQSGVQSLMINSKSHLEHIAQSLGGYRKLIHKSSNDIQKLLEGWSWKHINFDKYKYLDVRTNRYIEVDNYKVNPNDLCNKLGIYSITCSTLLDSTLLDSYLNALRKTSDDVTNVFNFQDTQLFGGYGFLNINLSNYVNDRLGEMYMQNGNMTLYIPNKKTIAHEWMHYLDNIIGMIHNVTLESTDKHMHEDSPLACAMRTLLSKITPSDDKLNKQSIDNSLVRILSALKHMDTFAIKSEFYDILKRKNYWNTRSEKLARAFEAYMHGTYDNAYYPDLKISTSINLAFKEFIEQIEPIIQMALTDQYMVWNSNLINNLNIMDTKNTMEIYQHEPN